MLKQPDHKERHLVVCELLAKTDSGPGIEGKEDERVGEQILYAVVEEAVRVELVS